MAFILKSSRLMSRLIGVACQANLANIPNDSLLLQGKNLVVTNAFLKRKYAAAAAGVMTADRLERSIHQLDLDARYKNKVFKKDIEQILIAIQKWKNVTYPQSLLLLKCCSSLCLYEKPEERVKLAKKVWDILSKLGIQFDIFHYNSLLNVYLENEYKFCPQEFLKALEEKGIEPNLITYQRLVKAYCQQGNIAGASSLLEKIKSANLPINDDIFNSLIYGHCQVNDIEGAMGIIELMKKKGIEPNSESYRHILCGYAKTGNIEEIRKTLDECEQKEIILLNKDLFEVVFSLAINGHDQYIDEILEKINKNFNYNSQAVLLIHKLLHHNLDSIGMKIYETLNKTTLENDTRSYGQFLVDYCVKYRSKDDLIELCQNLEEKGLVYAPLSYALKRTLEQGDNKKSLELITALKKKNLPIRSHYFWPIIKSASKIGNNEVLQVLKEMANLNVQRCYRTISKIVFPSYKFGSNWQKDLRALKQSGVDDIRISHFLLQNFLKEGKLVEAETLVRSKFILNNPVYIIPLLVNCLNREQSCEKAVVNILYGLIHDINSFYENNLTEQDSSSDEEADFSKERLPWPSIEKFVDMFLSKLVKQCPENIVLNVLKNMLEKKMAITGEAAAEILASFHTPEIKDLVEKLQSSKLELDQELISVKQKKKLNVHQLLRWTTLAGEEEKSEKLFSECGDQATFEDIMNMLLMYVRKNQFEKIVETCEKLPSNMNDDKSSSANKMRSRFLFFLKNLTETKDPDIMQKVLTIGIQKGIIDPNYYVPLIRVYLLRNEIDKAMELFCHPANENLVMLSCSALVEHLIQVQDAERLQKVIDVVSNIKGNSWSLFMVMFYLAHLGKTKQATKLFASQNYLISRNQVKILCEKFYNLKSKTSFENMLIVTKGSFDFCRDLFYNYLLKLYIESRETDKILDLCLQVQADNISLDQEFIDNLSGYLDKVNEPYPFNLSSIQTKIKANEPKEKLSKDEVLSSFEKALESSIPQNKAFHLALNLATFGETEKVLQILKIYDFKKGFRGIGRNMVLNGHMSEYLKFIENISETNPNALNRCLFVSIIARHSEQDPSVISKYKSIIMTAYDKTKNDMLLKSYFLYNLSLGRVKEAEEIYDEYLSGSVDLAKRIVSYNKRITQWNIVDALESSEKLKAIPQLPWGSLYIEIIRKYVNTDTDLALKYLKKAVDQGYSLPKFLLQKLKLKLQQENQDFPYPELLSEQSEKIS